MRKIKINSVCDVIQSNLWRSDEITLLQFLFSRGVKITVFAGGVRDVVLAQEYGLAHIEPRDWDIGITGICRKEFDGLFGELGAVKNKYGGFKLSFSGSQTWDIWRQEDTVGLLKTGSPFSLKNVLRSFVLSCNAIAFDLDTGYIFDNGALRSLSTGEVTVMEDAIIHDRKLFAAKALILTFRRPLKLGREMDKFVSVHLDKKSLADEFRKARPKFNVLTGSTLDGEEYV